MKHVAILDTKFGQKNVTSNSFQDNLIIILFYIYHTTAMNSEKTGHSVNAVSKWRDFTWTPMAYLGGSAPRCSAWKVP